MGPRQTLVTAVWIVASLFLTAKIVANPSTPHASRTLVFEFRDPRVSFESNAAAWQTLNQSIALGIDALNHSKGWNATLTGRSALFLGGLWVNSMLRFYSHEIAHEVVYRSHDVPIKNSLEWHNWKSSYLPGIYYPGWKQQTVDASELSDEDLIAATVAGLNQDELNAKSVWSLSQSRDQISFYDAQSYLLTKFRDVEYIIKSGSDEVPFAPGQRFKQLHLAVYADTPHLFDDVNLYRLALLNNGADMSTRQLLQRSLVADLLSWHTWENAYAILAYLIGGQHSSKPFSFFMGNHVRLSPPLVSHYLMTTGSFFNSSFVLDVNQQSYNVEIGLRLGYNSPVQGYRIRVVQDKWATRFWRMQPHIALNSNSTFNITGASLGISHTFLLSHNMAVLLKTEYNHNDIFETLVKREPNGFQTVFGLAFTL